MPRDPPPARESQERSVAPRSRPSIQPMHVDECFDIQFALEDYGIDKQLGGRARVELLLEEARKRL